MGRASAPRFYHICVHSVFDPPQQHTDRFHSSLIEYFHWIPCVEYLLHRSSGSPELFHSSYIRLQCSAKFSTKQKRSQTPKQHHIIHLILTIKHSKERQIQASTPFCLSAKKRCKSQISNVFIFSHLDYCNSLFTCIYHTSQTLLQLIQNAAARLLIRTGKRSPHHCNFRVFARCQSTSELII